MTDQKKDPEVVKTMTEEERIAMEIEIEERKASRRWQSGQSGTRLDTGIGHMGGAGAAGSGPDIGGGRNR